MKRTTRRQFVRKAGSLAIAAVALPAGARQVDEAFRFPETQDIPPQDRVDLPGVHAYADRQSVAAGDRIRFHVSSSIPYQMTVHRLGHTIDDPKGDPLLHRFPASPASTQPIHPGSYVWIEKRIRSPLRALTLECWARPWDLTRLQGLISQEDKEDSQGLALGVGAKGYVGFFLGDGVSPDEAVIHRSAENVLVKRRWHHIVATWDGRTKEIWVNGERVGSWPFAGLCQPGPHPLRLGAMSERKRTTRLYDGDLAMPAVYSRALSPDEIRARFAQKGLQRPPVEEQLIGCWPLDEERGDTVKDLSSHQRVGRIINHATWMIGGPSFDGSTVGRFSDYDPKHDAQRGHGLRFASDDLYDCRWKPSHAWRIPASTRPGLHVARIRFQQGGKPKEYDLTFLVRRAPGRPKAPIAMLCSTSTWLAYNATPFSETVPPGHFLDTNGYKNSHPKAPAYSCYRDHRAGQPSFQLGLRMPWPSASPSVLYSSRATGYSHLARAERFLHVWLERSGYDYDLLSDLDLHQNPDALQGYQTVILNGHSEYWSQEAYSGLDRYLKAGGTSIVLSGNTMFWRTTFSQDGTVMECRKYDERIGGSPGAPIGELFHSHDGQRGSLMRECGYPAWKVVGLECCGWGGVEASDAGVYHTATPEHFLFHQPETVGLKAGETFGHAPDGKSHRAIGHEYDVRLSTLIRMTRKTPSGGVLPAPSEQGMHTLAWGKRAQKNALDFFTQATETPEGVHAEMIYWERPQGGRVFHSGAIGTGWALSADPKLQALLRNVLHHFGIAHPASIDGRR